MFYGLDVHRAFIQVSGIDEQGDERVRCRVAATIEAISAFAESLNSEDEVVLEATFHTWAIRALVKEHVEKVTVANPLQVRAICAEYRGFYNGARPSQALHAIPDPYPELSTPPPPTGKLVALPALGGVQHDYRLVA